MKKLVIHLGAHRCGSTAIQSLLRRESKALSDAGVGVHLRADMAAGGFDLRRLHRYHPVNPLWQAKLKKTAGMVDRMAIDTLLVSEENLMGTMPTVRGRGFYPHFDRLMQSLKRLEALVHDPIILLPRLVVRRQDRYLESVYAFRVSRGMSVGFDAYLRAVTRTRISWLRLAQAFEQLPETIQPKIALLESWPKATAADKALSFLLGDNNIELSNHRLTGNIRYSAAGLRLILALNRAGVDWQGAPWKRDVFDLVDIFREDPVADVAYAIKHRVQARTYARFEKYYSTNAKLGFLEEERSAFLADYEQENREFLASPFLNGDPASWI